MHEPTLQFVLLCHTRHEDVHWDLGLDTGEALVTWQILENPEKLAASTDKLPARRIGDHRRAYLDYEGPVSGDRGQVKRVDRGLWHPLERSADRWSVRLAGQVLYGIYVLEHSSEADNTWTLYRSGD